MITERCSTIQAGIDAAQVLARKAGVKWDVLRVPWLVAIRAEIARHLRTEHNLSYPEIGIILNRDHSTICVCLNKGTR